MSCTPGRQSWEQSKVRSARERATGATSKSWYGVACTNNGRGGSGLVDAAARVDELEKDQVLLGEGV